MQPSNLQGYVDTHNVPPLSTRLYIGKTISECVHGIFYSYLFHHLVAVGGISLHTYVVGTQPSNPT